MSDLTDRAEKRLFVSRLGKLAQRETDKDLAVIADLLIEVRRQDEMRQRVVRSLESVLESVWQAAGIPDDIDDIDYALEVIEGLREKACARALRAENARLANIVKQVQEYRNHVSATPSAAVTYIAVPDVVRNLDRVLEGEK